MFPKQSLLHVSGNYLPGPKPSQWRIRKVHNLRFAIQRVRNPLPPAWSKSNLIFIIVFFFFHVLFYTAEIVVNYYSKNNEEPVSFLLRNVSPTLQAISAWHASMIIDSNSKSVQTLPVWLQDVLVNGLSFWRSGLYLRDGRWRQFECLDCFDIDSVHNDFQREILYVLFYPDLVENVMCAWAKYQGDNGQIVETLAAGCYSPTRKIDWCVYVAWENSRYFTTQPMFSPQNDAWGGNEPRNFIPMTCHYPDLGSASNWVGNLLYPIRRRTTTHDYWHVISMEFLRSFLRRHFAGKPVAASRNIGCFLRLVYIFLLPTHSLFPPNRTISHSSLDFNLLLTFEWLSVFVVMVCTRKNWMILLVLVNWNAWLDGDKPLKLKFLIYSPLEQPLNPTSNNNRDRMVKVFYQKFMVATNHVANSLW